MRVEVLPYDPAWPTLFQKMKSQLEEYLTNVPYQSIEHVGSTSVPGLAAKPLIDIDIVSTRAQLPGIIEALKTKGEFNYMGEWGVPDRHAFRKRSDPLFKTCNLYLCPEGSQSLRNHLAIRDLCRSDPEVREKYGKLKLELAQREWSCGDEYGDAKTELVTWMLAKAGMGEEDLEGVRKVMQQVTEEVAALKASRGQWGDRGLDLQGGRKSCLLIRLEGDKLTV